MQAITIRGLPVALSPLSSSGTYRLLDISTRLESDQKQTSVSDTKATVTEINNTDNSIVNARNSSLLYQVVDTLLDSKQSQSQQVENNQVYNRLLTASLVDNEQFMRSLNEREV